MDEARILDILIKLGYITKEQALRAQSEKGKDEDIISALLRLGLIDDTKLLDFYKRYFPNLLWKGSLQEIYLPDYIKVKLPEETLRKHYIAPIKYQEDKLYVLTINPFNNAALNE
ncbi:MAG: type II/IV secretion system protein, partial [Aquificota bacterium]